jgi:putative heme-binding domain-containing protein
MRYTITLAFIVYFPAFAFAQRDLKTIPPTDPEIERRSFEVADGFEVNLFASETTPFPADAKGVAQVGIAKPIQMNFDARGRLWVASSEVYPQISPGQKANDKVLVLEDVDGDGKADKTTIFADGLLIPTGVEPGDGGAYVANSTELLHLKDTNGDGKADARRIVLSGFGTEDTHHILHTLRWGWDGQLYMNQSIYIHSHIETPYGVKRLGGGGIWEFRPETMELDVFMRGLVNPWGHHFDRWGQSFATDGAGGEGINYVLPGAYYFTAPDAVRILPGLNPGSPKHCGVEVLSGRHLPESWRGNLITNDFRGHRVCRFIVGDDGAAFASREQPELIKTKHPAFRPIDVKMGPDGAIYIADWYNPIIQHGEVDFRDPRRDHTHGRIWRVTAKGRPTVERPKLVDAKTSSILDALKAPEDWTRHFAKRVLKERGAAVLPELAAWVKAIDPADPEAEHHRLEALWTYQSLNTAEPDLLARLLNSGDPRVRAAAVRVVQHWKDRLSNPLALLAPRVNDDHPRVRLEAVRVLGHIPGSASAELALQALDKPVDKFLDYALWLTARDLQGDWLPALQAGKFDDGGKPQRLVFALAAVGSPAVAKPLVEALKTNALAGEARSRAMLVVAALGGPDELGMALDLALNPTTPAAQRAGLLDTLAQATRQRKVRPGGDLARLATLLDSGDEDVQAAAARAVGVWKFAPASEKVRALATAKGAGPRARRGAIEGLAGLNDPASRATLEEIGRRKGSAESGPAIVALAGINVDQAAELAAAYLADSGASADGVPPLFEAFAGRKGGSVALARELGGVSIPADVAKVGLQVNSTSGRPEPKLVEALTAAGKLGMGALVPSPREREQIVAEVAQHGDPARGEAVFRRDSLQCLKCHAIAGAGGQVGPGLESIGASAQVDYILDSILEPAKAVKEGYHATVVATNDGKVLTGLKVRQSAEVLVLRDAEDREITIPASTIDEQKVGGSLMPAGLAEPLSRAELVDLVRFLSELGKVGPYSVSKAPVARRWQMLVPREKGSLPTIRAGVEVGLATNPSLIWKPAYAHVSGVLAGEDIPEIPVEGRASRPGLARCQVEVTTPGKVRLKLATFPGLRIWVDSKAIEPAPTLDVDLSTGVHNIMFLRDGNPSQGLRLELEDIPGSPARAQMVLGK